MVKTSSDYYISSRFSCNSEAYASELQENIEEIFLGTTWTVILSAGSNQQCFTEIIRE